MRIILFLLFVALQLFCVDSQGQTNVPDQLIQKSKSTGVSLMILGVFQDAGSPQISCDKSCCKALFLHPDPTRMVVSLGLIDAHDQKRYLFEATPDIKIQMKLLTGSDNQKEVADGIFLTHAHMGHYTGLMHLGKEAMDADQVPVYVMPRMKNFLTNNGPWSQLVKRNNIVLEELDAEETVQISEHVRVTPILVPHRDEFSETVGFRIQGPEKSALFIPDIDKWTKWEKNIVDEIRKVDYALLDATFFSGKEIGNRDISEIPHPFIIESLERFKNLEKEERGKVIFIHFNHTNPVIDSNSPEARQVIKQGFRIARMNDIYKL